MNFWALFLSAAARSVLGRLRRRAALASALARPRITAGQRREAVEEGARAERTANRLGGAEPRFLRARAPRR